ncbi:tyrosine-type recombinase/integrase [Gemmatimonadota bacterium]
MSVKKRTYESGAITWGAYVRVGPHRKRGNFSSFRDAKRAEAEWRSHLESQGYRHGDIPTVGDWAETVICEHVYGRDLRDAKKTAQILRRFANEFQNVRIDRITTDDLHRFLHRIKTCGYHGRAQSGSTSNRYRSWIHRLFNIAIRRGLLVSNPVTGIERFPENPRVRWLEPSEAQTLLEVCDPSLRPIVLCGLHLGARRGELMSLTWEDVDFDRNEISINSDNSKSGRGRRIPMTLEVRSCFEAFRLGGNSEGAVFRQGNGKCWSQFPKYRWKIALDKSGIADSKEERLEGFRFHDLRHTAATLMLEAGVELAVISRILGHSSLNITLKHYSHITRPMQQDALTRLSRVLAANTEDPITDTTEVQSQPDN